MKRGWSQGQVGFEPPSDFVPDASSGGGGGKKLWLKIFGIGCGGLLLLTAIVFATGAFKVASCCGDLQTAGLNSVGAAQRALSFGAAVQEGDYASAQPMLAPPLSGDLASADQLKARFAEFEPIIRGGTLLNEGMIGGTQVESFDEVANMKEWRFKIRYYPNEGDEAVVMEVEAALLTPAEGETPATFGVSGLSLTRQTIDIRRESPGRAVLALHGFLQGGDLRRAYGAMHPESYRDQGGQPQFEAFIQDQGTLFTQSTMELIELRYVSSDRAQVTAELATSKGEKAIVTYDLTTFMSGDWRVQGISPLVQAVPTEGTEAPAEEAPEEGSEAPTEEAPGEGSKAPADAAE